MTLIRIRCQSLFGTYLVLRRNQNTESPIQVNPMPTTALRRNYDEDSGDLGKSSVLCNLFLRNSKDIEDIHESGVA